MAILDSDLILVGRGGNSFRVNAQELKDFVATGDGVTYRGTADFTVAPVLDPSPPVVGDLYINTNDGTLNAGWAAGGQAVSVGDRALWDGSAWEIIGSTSDIGVEDISVVAPIIDTGSPSSPEIGISAATNSAAGSCQLANDPGNAGELVTDSATDVLIKSHFDELDRRIGVATGGGLTGVTGTAPIEASTVGTAVTVSIADATTAAPGAVQLQDSVTNNATNAATPNAVLTYAVPLDLRTLGELV